MKKVQVTKLEAAKNQLGTALDLFFQEEDIVSIHTLASAAHQILEDIAKEKKVDSIREEFLKSVPLDKKTLVRDVLRSPANFLKHADRDSNQVLHFPTLATEMVLLDAYVMYTKLTDEKFHLGTIFQVWFYINYPEITGEENRKLFDHQELRNKSPKEFLLLSEQVTSKLNYSL